MGTRDLRPYSWDPAHGRRRYEPERWEREQAEREDPPVRSNWDLYQRREREREERERWEGDAEPADGCAEWPI